MSQAYIYEIEHIRTGKKYIGSRSKKNCYPDELLAQGGYHTSSKVIGDIIKREGLAAFKINYIITCKSRKDAIRRETEKLLEVDAKNNDGYFNLHNNEGEANIQKLCDLHGVNHPMQTPNAKEKMRRKRLGEKNPFFGKTHSEDTKEKIRSRLQGEGNPMYGVSRLGEASPHYGHKHTEEAKRRVSEANKGRTAHNKGKLSPQDKVTCHHCNKTGGTGNMKRYHFDNCKQRSVGLH